MNKEEFQRCAAVHQKQKPAAATAAGSTVAMPVRAPVAMGPRPPAPRPPLGAYILPVALHVGPLPAVPSGARPQIITIDGGGRDE